MCLREEFENKFTPRVWFSFLVHTLSRYVGSFFCSPSFHPGGKCLSFVHIIYLMAVLWSMCWESRCAGETEDGGGKRKENNRHLQRTLGKVEGKRYNKGKRIRDNNAEEIDVRNYKELVARIAGWVLGSYRRLGREILG